MPGLLATKIHLPTPPPRMVQRAHLLRRLDEGVEAGRKLTLVSAPAGFGKTTCIAEWVNRPSRGPASWLSLDAADDDPGRFFTYLATALQKIDPCIAREISASLQAGQLLPAEALSTILINDISAVTQPFWLILDDFHLIQDRFILQVIETLIANLPSPLRLVLLTREDPSLPLARLRAHNQLTEIRADDLRFRPEETSDYFKQVIGLDLSEADIAALEDRTEGWVVGLQLAGLSMRGRADPSNFIATLSGSHRHILGYLTEEVLARQPQEIQDFLLQTSILDKLSGELCDAVTGRTDSGLVLERLLAANLFLVPLDDEQRWYRYHHLFADLLRIRRAAFQGEQTAESHRRASRWFAQACQGCALSERAALVSEAIQHALAAQDYPAAVELIETHAMEIINQWHARAVHSWMQALPPEWSARSPRTNLAFARMHLLRGDFAQASPYLERLQTLFSSSQAGARVGSFAPELRAGWLALQSNLFSAQGKSREALAMALEALESAPEVDSETQSQVYLALATAYQQLDDPARATQAYQKLIQLGRAAGNMVTEVLGLSALSLMAITRGQLHYGFDLAAQAAEKIERTGGLLPIGVGIYGELGQVAFHWYRLDDAERYFQRAEQVSVPGGISDAGIYFAVFRSRLSHMRGDLEAADREIRKAASVARADAPFVVREEVIAQQVNVALAQNHLAEAEQLLYPEADPAQGPGVLPEPALGQDFPYPRGVLYISTLRVRLYQARTADEPAAALPRGIELAGRLLEIFTQHQYVSLALETLLLRAQLHALRGDNQASLADVATALDLAEPEGYISTFVTEGQPIAGALALLLQRSQPGTARANFTRKILDAFPQPRESAPAAHAGMPEQLTSRELDVLRLIAAGQTYAEIAGRLVVSINTVRSHVKSIYGKLGANNRTNAVEAARNLNLL